MAKETKEIITREFIKNELKFYNTADIRASLVLGVSFSLVGIPLALILITAAVSTLENLFLQIAAGLLFGLLPLSPTIAFIFEIFSCLADKKRLERDEFDVVTRNVNYKCEIMRRRTMVEVLHFDDFGELEVSDTIYQLSDAGDTFYLVIFKTPKPQPRLYYTSKIYEYREQ